VVSPAAGQNLSAPNGIAMQAYPQQGHRFISTGAESALGVQQFGMGASCAPAFTVDTSETATVAADAFVLGASITARKNGGATGSREALHVEQHSSSSTASEFVVGVIGIGRAGGATGQVFGGNFYGWTDAGVASTAQVCGMEANTDVRGASVSRKVGLQVVDVGTSVGAGTIDDNGIQVGAQAGGGGYSCGLMIGFNGTSGFGIFEGGTLIAAKPTTRSIRAGIDFEGQTNWTTAPIVLRPATNGVKWGSASQGGAILSETATNGPDVVFAAHAVTLRTRAAAVFASFKNDQTFLSVSIGGSALYREVLADAADSAGTGFRRLRVAN
jgi:hypothetical protein